MPTALSKIMSSGVSPEEGLLEQINEIFAEFGIPNFATFKFYVDGNYIQVSASKEADIYSLIFTAAF